MLQIGCDPKHDSTKSIINGIDQLTVLDAVKMESGITLEDVMIHSRCGVDCIESGGPEPGIGCAGRGIITAMTELERLGLDQSTYDAVIYDVLGDVVCGGFAIPLRVDYSDAVLLVTSGEFMSIYAANNILRGALNHSPDIPRIGGIILNRKGLEDEDDAVERFAKAVGLPVVSRLSRDSLYAQAERDDVTVSEAFPESLPKRQFSDLADYVLGIKSGQHKLYTPHPLSDSDLDTLIKGKRVPPRNEGARAPIRKGTHSGEACAARGAVSTASEVIDLPIIVHGPKSCGYNMANIRDVHFLGDCKNRSVFSMAYRNNVQCSDMTDLDSIFGGIGKLEATVRRLYSAGEKTMMVITACIPGIIGDDVDSFKTRMEAELDGLTLLLIKTDGNILGDVRAGIGMVKMALAGLIEPTTDVEKGKANLIYFAGMSGGIRAAQVRELFDCVGLHLGTVLFKDCTLDEIRNAGNAEFNIPVTVNDMHSEITAEIETRGMRILDRTLPIGIGKTEEWVRSFNNGHLDGATELYLERNRSRYLKILDKGIPMTRGRSVYIAIRFLPYVDWVVETLRDLEMDVIRVASIGPNRPLPLQDDSLAPISSNIEMLEMFDEFQMCSPDLLLCDFRTTPNLDACIGMIPRGNIGMDASSELAEYVTNIMRTYNMAEVNDEDSTRWLRRNRHGRRERDRRHRPVACPHRMPQGSGIHLQPALSR